jgi:hypothetical protein
MWIQCQLKMRIIYYSLKYAIIQIPLCRSMEHDQDALLEGLPLFLPKKTKTNKVVCAATEKGTSVCKFFPLLSPPFLGPVFAGLG